MCEKQYEFSHIPTILAFLSLPNRAYSSLNKHLEACSYHWSINTVRVLSYRIYLWSDEWIYSHTGFYNGQVGCFNMKVFVFVEPVHMWGFFVKHC